MNRFCTSCGCACGAQDNFCTACGAPLIKQEAPTQAPLNTAIPPQQQPTQPQNNQAQKNEQWALVSMVLGIVAVAGAWLPLIGLPVCITGIVFGVMGKDSAKRNNAIAGIVLSAVGLLIFIGKSFLPLGSWLMQMLFYSGNTL